MLKRFFNCHTKVYFFPFKRCAYSYVNARFEHGHEEKVKNTEKLRNQKFTEYSDADSAAFAAKLEAAKDTFSKEIQNVQNKIEEGKKKIESDLNKVRDDYSTKIKNDISITAHELTKNISKIKEEAEKSIKEVANNLSNDVKHQKAQIHNLELSLREATTKLAAMESQVRNNLDLMKGYEEKVTATKQDLGWIKNDSEELKKRTEKVMNRLAYLFIWTVFLTVQLQFARQTLQKTQDPTEINIERKQEDIISRLTNTETYIAVMQRDERKEKLNEKIQLLAHYQQKVASSWFWPSPEYEEKIRKLENEIEGDLKNLDVNFATIS